MIPLSTRTRQAALLSAALILLLSAAPAVLLTGESAAHPPDVGAPSPTDMEGVSPAEQGAIFPSEAREAYPPEVEAAAARLEQELVAPCCWNQTLAAHQSSVADEMRKELRARLASGESPEAILESYVEEHGLRILSKPPAVGFQRLLYVLPPIFLVASAVGLVLYGLALSRRRGPDGGTSAPDGSEGCSGDEELRERLRREIEESDRFPT